MEALDYLLTNDLLFFRFSITLIQIIVVLYQLKKQLISIPTRTTTAKPQTLTRVRPMFNNREMNHKAPSLPYRSFYILSSALRRPPNFIFNRWFFGILSRSEYKHNKVFLKLISNFQKIPPYFDLLLLFQSPLALL